MRIAWRQVSPGRGDAPGTKVLKLFIDTWWVRIPPVKADHQPKRVLRSRQYWRHIVTSVDSGYKSRVIEPRNSYYRRSLRTGNRGGSTETLKWSGVEVRPGSWSRANVYKGVLGTWEIQDPPSLKGPGKGLPVYPTPGIAVLASLLQ